MKLTPRQQQVYDVLDYFPRTAGQIANGAGISTRSPRETAAKYAIELVALGLAEKCGSRMFPAWRRAAQQRPGETA